MFADTVMIPLTRRTKESIKTALAMTVAYGIALSMDWERPYWAGFAVAFCSLDTLGQSMNKAAMRMLGTLVAFVVALILISLFSQDRWLFFMFLSAYVGFCAFMMGRSKRVYFWQVSAFVVAVVAFDGAGTSVNTFETALLRVEETGLGILVYGIVATYLWPTNAQAEFDAALRKLASTRLQLYRRYLALMRNPGDDAETAHLRAQGIQQQARVDQLLEGAIADTYEVWEVRHLWRYSRQQAADLAETMERWRQGFTEVRALDLRRLLPNLEAFGAELDLRFTQVERMLAGQAPEQHPTPFDLTLDKAALRSLSHFHRAALVVARTRLQRLETLSRALFETVQDIKGFGRPTALPTRITVQPPGFALDLDSLAAVARLLIGFAGAYLIWIYTTVPGGTGFPSMAISLGLMFVAAPRLRVSAIFAPFAVGLAFASVLYVFVMPKLSSFTELGLMIFAVTFAIRYLFHGPQNGLAQALGMLTFVVIIGISNQQSYDFLHVANTSLQIGLVLTLLWFVAYFPVSPRPEKAFLRLLRRFFASCDYLVSTPWPPQQPAGRLERWRRSFHAYEIATLPAKLGAWGTTVESDVLTGASPEQLETVVTGLQALAVSTQALLAARDLPQAELLVEELLEDVREWRERVQAVLHAYAHDLAVDQADALHDRLTARLEHLEARIEETLDTAPAGAVSEQDSENFYVILGAWRSISEAVIDFARAAGAIEWARWREARF